MLNKYISNLISGVSAGSLFPQMPTIYFLPEFEICPQCGSKLYIRKTIVKTIITMYIGAFRSKETVLQCPYDQTIFTSEQLRALAPSKCTFGYDVIEYVGMALFAHCRNEQEIMKELAARNISISERQISNLGRKFVIYLALAHRESRELLRCSMKKSGGYILHLDGTCEGDSPHLFCGLDGISELVLDNIKIPSENKELLVPFFHRIKEQYGNPVALVHDMGVGILAAVEEVFPDVLDFICHFHFLRDIGKDLLGEDYQTIIKCLRKHNIRTLLRQKAKYLEKKIRENTQTIAELKANLENGQFKKGCVESMPTTAYVLIHWAFDSLRQSQGYGFPFDCPHHEFYRRLKQIHRLLGNIIDIQPGNKAKDHLSFIHLWQLLEKVIEDTQLNEADANMEAKEEVFNKLRQALRIALPEGKNGLNDDGDDETDMKTIEKRVSEFRDWLVSDACRQKTYTKMIKQMEKYWEKLFADPIVVNTSEGKFIIVPQRTNNILERFFRGEKKRARKKSGTASLSKTLKTILADTPLVRNLENEEYYKIILNGCLTLAERFSQVDAKVAQEQLKQAQNNQEKISPELRKIIRQSDLLKKISTLFLDPCKIEANCHLRS